MSGPSKRLKKLLNEWPKANNPIDLLVRHWPGHNPRGIAEIAAAGGDGDSHPETGGLLSQADPKQGAAWPIRSECR